ncbi:hypothetical protein SCLCIDRAFT_1224494 [Scleroderma citrinum Foug A]|uniref:Uncharacterized protein n=1 Tax=Scleroderma citrinum Foug A TaxID=1036808 RepID=A0A0C3CSB8_9AGAM|nr:hypothetical protein SCLCIDRAFT_1224494 [Scleroderma citrinum Foug A]
MVTNTIRSTQVDEALTNCLFVATSVRVLETRTIKDSIASTRWKLNWLREMIVASKWQ